MPEKCEYCGEKAVIEECVNGGPEQLICIECGSLATCLTSRNRDSGGTDDTYWDGSNPSHICESCGITLSDTGIKNMCSDCLLEESNENNESTDSIPDLDDGIEGISKADIQSDLLKRRPDPSKIAADPTDNKDYPGTKCVSCGSRNLLQEYINGDERLICSDCGGVNSDSVLTAYEYCPTTRSKNNTFTTLPRFCERQKRQEGLKAGLNTINLLCIKYCFSADIKSEAEEMYKNLFHHPDVLHLKIKTKENIAASCLFIVCRQNNFPISLTHFRDDVDEFKSFLKANRHVLKVCNIQLPHMSIVDQLSTFLSDLGFGGRMGTRVKDILFLCRRAWLTQGRSRMGLIIIATYYAYVSSDMCHKFIPLNKFCQKFKIAHISHKLAQECKMFFLKLAQSLPWVSKTVKNKNLHVHINDILKYQDSLFHLCFKSDDDRKRPLEEDEKKPIEESLDSDEKKQLDLPQEQNEHTYSKNRHKRKEELLPSAAKRKRLANDDYKSEYKYVVPQGINLDSTELHESEFEEEINTYILSAEEQASLMDHKKSLWKK